MYGAVLISTACGTINSDGLPYQPLNPDGSENEEYGSPLINGDGFILKFDLNTAAKSTYKRAYLSLPVILQTWQPAPKHHPIIPIKIWHLKTLV